MQKNANIDIYFDEYDKTLSDYVREGDASKVTERIKDGISKSTHMLGVLYPSTLLSLWVPFEVGFGYDKTKMQVLTRKGIDSWSLQDYLKIIPIIRDTKSLNN